MCKSVIVWISQHQSAFVQLVHRPAFEAGYIAFCHIVTLHPIPGFIIQSPIYWIPFFRLVEKLLLNDAILVQASGIIIMIICLVEAEECVNMKWWLPLGQPWKLFEIVHFWDCWGVHPWWGVQPWDARGLRNCAQSTRGGCATTHWYSGEKTSK